MISLSVGINPATNPSIFVNELIQIGLDLHIQTIPVDPQEVIGNVMQKMDLDALELNNNDLARYRYVIENIEIMARDFFSIGTVAGKIGTQLTIQDYDQLKSVYHLYQEYRDPRIRDPTLLNVEALIERILRTGRMEALNSDGPITLDLSQIKPTTDFKLNSIEDIHTLKWQRSKEHIEVFSLVLLKYIIYTLKRGWTINPGLIRLLNILDQNLVKQAVDDMNLFFKSRIATSLQKLADIMYISNFGSVNEIIYSTLIDDLTEKPIEDRLSMPHSDATDIIGFLNFLRSYDPEFYTLSRYSRRIGVLTKPVSEEAQEFIGFNTSGDAIREVLSVIHYSMDHHEDLEMIQTIYDTITDPDFNVIMMHFFDPAFELLHTPLLTMTQSIKERIWLDQKGDDRFGDDVVSSISGIQNWIYDVMRNRSSMSEFLEIWEELNAFLEPQVKRSIKSRSVEETMDLIRGKEIILNVMTPLLLAKYEGRGFNPLAAKTRDLHGSMKSITGTIAIASNFKSDDLQVLFDTIFIEAPEVVQDIEAANTSPKIPGPPSAPSPTTGLPVPPNRSEVDEGSHLIPTKMGIALARIANKYVTGGGERNLHRALVDLIKFTKTYEQTDTNILV